MERCSLCWKIENSCESCEKRTGTVGKKTILQSVYDDLKKQEAKGLSKYATTLDNANLTLKEVLQHAYEETLDQLMYLKSAINKING